MSFLRGVVVPPLRYRARFNAAVALAFLALLSLLLFLPRGDATGEPIVGEPVSVQVTDDVSLRLEPSVRELGWRESTSTRPFELSVWTTVINDSDEDFDDSISMEIMRDSKNFRGVDVEVIHYQKMEFDLLTQAVVPPGESATFLLTFMADSACGNFTAYVDFSRFDVADPAEAFVAPSVEIPFTVGDPPCE